MDEAEGTDVVVDEPLAEEASDTDDQMIWPVSGVKRRRKAYIQLPGMLWIFPDVTPATFCELADMKTVSPSRVLAIIPMATVAQLCDFCKLTETLQAPDIAVDEPPHIPDPPPARLFRILALLAFVGPFFFLNLKNRKTEFFYKKKIASQPKKFADFFFLFEVGIRKIQQNKIFG